MRRDFHLIVSRFVDVPAFRQLSETPRHLRERVVGLQEISRFRIDQGDAARHVGQDLFVKNHFALDAARRFGLASVKFSEKPRCDRGSAISQATGTVILPIRSCTG